MPPRENTDEAGVPHQCSRADPCLLRVGFRRMGMMHIAHHMYPPTYKSKIRCRSCLDRWECLTRPSPSGPLPPARASNASAFAYRSAHCSSCHGSLHLTQNPNIHPWHFAKLLRVLPSPALSTVAIVLPVKPIRARMHVHTHARTFTRLHVCTFRCLHFSECCYGATHPQSVLAAPALWTCSPRVHR